MNSTYRTDTDAAAALVPADVEIDENPIVNVRFAAYGRSTVAPFREFIQSIRVRFRGEDLEYVPHIYITDERGMLAGREREGLPKLLGHVDFDTGKSAPEGVITARLSRPAGVVLAQEVFRPSDYVQDLPTEHHVFGKLLGLRVFGSAVPGGELAVAELVPSSMEFFAGEVWSGDGSLLLTGASELSPIHRLPIRGEIEAVAFLNVSAQLVRPTETYPLQP